MNIYIGTAVCILHLAGWKGGLRQNDEYDQRQEMSENGAARDWRVCILWHFAVAVIRSDHSLYGKHPHL
jgi:hypothetical protein